MNSFKTTHREKALSKLVLTLSVFFLFSYLSSFFAYTTTIKLVNVSDFHHTETEKESESESKTESYGNLEVDEFFYCLSQTNHDFKSIKNIKYSFLYRNLNINQGYIPPKVRPPIHS